MENIGNKLYSLTDAARKALFQQGQLTQLTYRAFDIAVFHLHEQEEETIEISFPIGWRPDGKTMNGTKHFQKSELLEQYQFLAINQLAVNGIIRLVTIIETMIEEIVRALVLKYPKKLGAKRSVPMQFVLEAATIEDVHVRAKTPFSTTFPISRPPTLLKN